MLFSPRNKGFDALCQKFFAFALTILLLALASYAERLPVKTYTTADGLPRDLVTRIRQDSRGFLWFCTGEGLSRFDGVGMMNFTTSDGLPNRTVNDFLETSSGTIYIATGKGLARLNPRGVRGSTENPLFTTFLPENPKSEKIQILYKDRKNQVWVGTSDGLYKLIETGETVVFEPVPLGKPLEGFGGPVFVPSPDTIFVNAILEDSHGTLWVATFGSGLFRLSLDGSVKQFHADADGFGDNKITALLEDGDGRIWMGMRSDEKGGVCVLEATADENPLRKCFSQKDGLGSNRIRDMLKTSDGQVWLGTVAGLCRWQGEGSESVCKTYTAANDLCGDIYTLAEDREGNLWTGSTCGVKKIARYGFTTYSEADGLTHPPINAMFENSKGELFATNFPRYSLIVSRFDGEKFTSVKPRFPDYVNYYGWGWQQTVWQDSMGAWWIPTGFGIFRSPDNTRFENLSDVILKKQESDAKGEDAFRIFEDSHGDIWVSITTYANELLRWERAKNVWHNHTGQAEISVSRVVTAFSEDRHGNLWIGVSSDHGDGALIRYRNGEFRVFTAAEGATSGWTTDLFLDSQGRLWIATTEDGLLRLDETNSDQLNFIKYTPANGLTSITTNCLTEDEFGRIYIGTWRGIDRLNPETGQVENFSNADGLPSGYIESAYRDRKNNLWFMTDKGLARFQPEPVRVRKPPNILITGLRVEGDPQNISILGETSIPPFDLRSDQRQITVEFLGLGTSLGEKLKYEYRFGETDWRATDERTLNFNLAANDYRFEVRAQTADGIYSQTPASFSFKIAAPLWQRWWFLLSAAGLIALAVYWLYQNRLRRMLEIERTRTRIATDLHDDIGSNLTKISIMSEVAQRIEGNKQGEILHSIADISRSSVASMSDIVWAINPKKDSLLELTRRMRSFAEDILGQKDISLEFHAPEVFNEVKLDADTRRNVFLIFKESLNNIVRHSGAEKVEIDLEIIRNKMILTVTDDGTGFDAEQNFDGNGLSNMKRRATDLNGYLEIFSAQGKGTKIVLEIPS